MQHVATCCHVSSKLSSPRVRPMEISGFVVDLHALGMTCSQVQQKISQVNSYCRQPPQSCPCDAGQAQLSKYLGSRPWRCTESCQQAPKALLNTCSVDGHWKYITAYVNFQYTWQPSVSILGILDSSARCEKNLGSRVCQLAFFV